MNILLLGSGGREHAIAWKLRQSKSVDRIVCAPGNPGIAAAAELRAVDIMSPDDVVALARELNPDFVFIGPEQPLSVGVSDALRAAGFKVFGPSKAAARIEWDKTFSKDFMRRHAIPTAAYRSFAADEISSARNYLLSQSLPIVIKANGLMAGKGVVVATTPEQALATVNEMLTSDIDASVVIEEFMEGDEASVFAICDGEKYVTLAPSQDHKRLSTGDVGPNTGGMGAYAPAPIVTDQIMRDVCSQIIEPVLRGMVSEGSPYNGCLYVGLMIKDGSARVVEFNSRFGDPETQVVLPLIDADFADLSMSVASGTLASTFVPQKHGSAVCVVMASKGYPISSHNGDVITGLDSAEAIPGVVVFHAGTAVVNDTIVTKGGRVLGVTAVSDSDDMQQTIQLAYQAVEHISFDGAQYRTDIGGRLLATLSA